jgi:hypothetical protein
MNFCTIPDLAGIASAKLDEMQIDGFGAFALFVRLGLVAHPLPFIEGRKTRPLHGGDVEKNIGAASIRGDEAEPFVGIEKFDCALLRHISLPDFTTLALLANAYFLRAPQKPIPA